MARLKYIFLVLIVWIDVTNSLMSEAQVTATKKLVRRSCKAKAKVTNDEELDGMLNGKWENISPEAKCYLECCLKFMKTVKSDGHIDYDSGMKQAKTVYPELGEASEKTLEQCKTAGDDLTDKCEIAYEISKCFYHSNSKYYLIP